MKLFFSLIFSLIFPLLTWSQIGQKTYVDVNSKQYDSLKKLNLLDVIDVKNNLTSVNYNTAIGQNLVKPKKGEYEPKASGCSCYKEPDATYILAMGGTDDGSSSLISLPFNFCFYGDTVNSLFINNNGNITFGASLYSFNSTAFPSNNTQIIAPFWADVDTRNGNGQVLYKITPTAIYINWVDVGYYSMQGDKKNTFQLILTNGADPVIDGGNVAFCYKNMQWTTGSASQGVNGFGGTPATAGANKGNNIDYFLIARFDHAGTDFDGALGNNDGISWLDFKSFFFDVCNTNNIPPIPNGLSSCDTFRICAIGDTADFPVIFLSPEANQITSITVNNGGLNNLTTIVNNSGNTAEMVIRAWGDLLSAGTYSITVTATDNYIPSGVTNLTFTIIIDSLGVSNMNPIISPTTGCGSVQVGVLNGPYDSYFWSDLTTGPNVNLSTSSPNLTVTVEKNGCFKKVSKNISVAPLFNMNMQGNLNMCPNTTSTTVSFPDSLLFGPISWGLSNPILNAHYSNNLSPGTYTVSILGPLGICQRDTTFTITNFAPISFPADGIICGTQYLITGGSGGSGFGSWSYLGNGPAPVIQSPNTYNTNVLFSQEGNYELLYTDANCPIGDTVNVAVGFPFSVNYQGLEFYCPGSNGSQITIIDSLHNGTVTWGSAPNLNGVFSHLLPSGNYTITLTDTANICSATKNFTISTQLGIALMADTVICDSVLTMANNNGGGTNGLWTLLSGPGTITWQDPSLLNQTISFDNFGVYSIMFEDLVCPNSDTLTVNYSAGPTVIFNTSDFYVCPEQKEYLYLVDSLNLNSASWGLSSAGQDSLFGALLGSGIYTVEIVDLFGCSKDSTFEIVEQLKIQLNPISEYCGDDLSLINNQGVDGGNWSMLNGPGVVTFTPNDSLNSVAMFSKYGVYQLVYSENFCNDADTFTIDITFFPYSEVPDYVGCLGTPQTAQAFDILGNGDQFLWSNGQTGPTAAITEGGFYTLTTVNKCGSQEWDFQFETRVCDVDMPNVFTPNGDEANAYFKPINGQSAAFQLFSCKIYNRWGNLLFEFTNLDTGWDGRIDNGKFVIDGVYFYTVNAVNMDGDPIDKQGFFHVFVE